jgi:ABC-type glycerol-3-phosphate transport system permease component
MRVTSIGRRRLAGSVRGWGSHFVLIVFVVLTVYPIFFLLNVSMKSMFQFYSNPLAIEWPEGIYAYVVAWRLVKIGMVNTTIITVVSLAGLLCTASTTAYIFARHRFPGSTILFYLLLALLMIPSIVILVPLLVLVAQMGLVNTLWAAILPYIAGAQAFNIFVMRTFFASLPEELFESARLDGAGHVDIIVRIVIPLSIPILVVVSILHVLYAWNDIAWPLLVLNDMNVRTIALHLLQFQNPLQTYPTAIFAGSVIASVPLFVMFFFGMRHFVSGLLTGALKL